MLLNVGEVLCGGIHGSGSFTPSNRRASRSVVSLNCASVAYHNLFDLSSVTCNFAKILFRPVKRPRNRPPRPSGQPAPARLSRRGMIRRATVCRLLTEHGIGGDVYTLTAAPPARTGAVITFQSVSPFQPLTKRPAKPHKHCIFTCLTARSQGQVIQRVLASILADWQ